MTQLVRLAVSPLLNESLDLDPKRWFRIPVIPVITAMSGILRRWRRRVALKGKAEVSIRDAARATGIPRSTLYGWVAGGKIPYQFRRYRPRGGSMYRVRIADVVAYRASGRVTDNQEWAAPPPVNNQPDRVKLVVDNAC